LDYSDAHQADRRSEVNAEQLGPYSLIAEISSGDFTTVHLAHKQGAHGFDRLVAIKRLKPAFARQPEWSQLLLDEARLGASVDHPNTVDILDVGTDAGVYVVMDYVEGADFEQLLARAGRERHPRYIVPPIIDALTGLHAIHTQRDELGEPLAMVHQAPRARHILVGIHGNARITDFSQVTARGLIPSTLRGKGLTPAYIAPEQVLVSEPVSARTDVFILGITLWEALTGERLFQGETPSLVRRAITERDIPKPSEVGLQPPRCFDGICMRALQRNPELRYQTAAEMARDLREVAQDEALLASAGELGQWVRALASRSLLERRRALGADDPSQEISLEVLEERLAADRARESALPPARESRAARESAVEIEDLTDADGLRISVVVEEEPPVAPSITVPVYNPSALRTPPPLVTRAAAQTQRSATGTLLGVTAKPRTVGLPPPAPAATLKRTLGAGLPQYRGSLGRTASQHAPSIEVSTPPAHAERSSAVVNTLPEGAMLSELDVPISLPAAPPGRSAFVGFSDAIDPDIESFPMPPPLRPRPPKAKLTPWQETAGSYADGELVGAALASSAAPAGASTRPTTQPAPGAPTQPALTRSALDNGAASAWTTPPAAAPAQNPVPAATGAFGSSGAAPREQGRRKSDPPLRSSRIPPNQTLDGHVPTDVFERLRPAPGAVDSWRPPTNAVRQPWQEEQWQQPSGRGPLVALAAALAVAAFFGYQHLTAPAARVPAFTPAPAPHATGIAGVRNNFDPMAPRALNPARPPVATAPAPVVPPVDLAPPPEVLPVVPPVGSFELGTNTDEPPAPPPRSITPEPRVAPARTMQAAPAPTPQAAPVVAKPRREVPPRAAAPVRGPRSVFKPEPLPDNPY
jgi:eukaryotic-like serine/threonine-protein kinase